MIKFNILDYAMFFLFVGLFSTLNMENVTPLQSMGLIAGFGWSLMIVVRIIRNAKQNAKQNTRQKAKTENVANTANPAVNPANKRRKSRKA